MGEKATEMERLRLELNEECVVCRQPVKDCLCDMLHAAGD